MRTRTPFLLPALPLLAGCAAQMPPVAGFFSGHAYQLENHLEGSLGTRGEFAVDESRYLCQDATVDSQAVLRCIESPGWRLYGESLLRYGVGAYAGESWRVGLGGSSPGLQLGWRQGHLGVMTWAAPRLGNELTRVEGAVGGLVLAQRFAPKPWLSLGLFESLGRTGYIQLWRQDSTMPRKARSYDEASLGGWMQFHEGGASPGPAVGSLQARIGRELERSAWRLHLTVTLGMGRSQLW